MSEYKVPFTTVLTVHPHANAHSLDVATVYGFQVVVRKDSVKVGDSMFYIPIDSVIPNDLELILFGPDSKIKLEKGRVKQIRIRQFPSQGMLVSESDIIKLLEQRGVKDNIKFKLEQDYQELTSIVKYEPPAAHYQGEASAGKKASRGQENPLFHKYQGLENIKWYPSLFKEGEEVVIEEKIHGSNARAGMLPTQADTLLKKIKKLLGLLPKYEFSYGSNNVDLTSKRNYKGYYGEDVYGQVFKEIDAKSKIPPNHVVYGEIYGDGIQKNYNYGLKNEKKFILFDVKVFSDKDNFVWLGPEEAELFAHKYGFDFVPVLYRGVWDQQVAHALTKGRSVLSPSQKIREGVVIKARNNYNDSSCAANKRALKWVSEDYLDKDNSDFH